MRNDATRQTPMRRKLIGRKLKLARKKAGLALRHPEIAERAGSTRTAQRLEEGEATSLSFPVIGSLCDLYGMRKEEKFELERLWRLGPATTWTQPRGRGLFGFNAFHELQLHASVVYQYESTFIPGQLQSENHMRMLFGHNPELTEAQAEHEVQARLRNQQPFWDASTPVHHFLLSEAVLRFGCDIEQIDRLVEADSLDHATVRYLPFSGGPPNLMHLPFILLSFAAEDDPDIVFVEAQNAYLYFEEAESVRHYRGGLNAVAGLARSIKEFKL
ncbi:helix-turn-helix transcriptional regulator [Glycomyces sp. YM15]|uniref:helix-turn-helix domain-containing protein n=1 Tax=Glycomyces sp. YM15 TaxID=2800446 RepID=UPI00196556B4|nr:helix-turn-helix transcriptional regulator [Glycomyces sp. YM15]